MANQIAKFILYFSPKPLQEYLLKQNQKQKIKQAKERLKIKVSKDYLTELFDKININSDVFVHSSLLDIGKVEGGYKTIVNLLTTKILDKGYTLLFSALPHKGSSEEFLKITPVFNASKASVETGVINDYFSMLPEAKRSLSPTHSVVAIGEKAQYYTNEHHLSVTPFSEKSPYFRIVEHQGKIMMIGARLSHLTLCHLIEDLIGDDFPKKIYCSKKYEITVIDENNRAYNGKFKAHDSFTSLFRQDNIFEDFKKIPSTQIYQLGASELIVLDAVDVTLSLLNILKNGVTIYGKVRPSKKCVEKANSWIDYFKALKKQ